MSAKGRHFLIQNTDWNILEDSKDWISNYILTTLNLFSVVEKVVVSAVWREQLK